MDSLLQSVSGLAIRLGVHFLHEPHRSAVGPILLGIWEGACWHYISNSSGSDNALALYLAYGGRFLLYFHASNEPLNFFLTILWTVLAALLAEAVSPSHGYDTLKEKHRQGGSRRTVYTHISPQDREVPQRRRSSNHTSSASWVVVPSPVDMRTSERTMHHQPPAPTPALQRVFPPTPELIPAKQPTPASPAHILPPPSPDPPPRALAEAAKDPIPDFVDAPIPVARTTPPTPIPPAQQPIPNPMAPPSPVSIVYSPAVAVSTPAPEYTAAPVMLPIPRSAQSTPIPRVAQSPPISRGAHSPPGQLSPIDAMPALPQSMQLQTAATPISQTPMLFRPAPSIAQVLERAEDPSAHLSPPQSPIYIADDADPLQTPLNSPGPPGARRALPRHYEDDPLMTPRHLSGSMSDSDDGQAPIPVASSSRQVGPPPPATSENATAIPVPMPRALAPTAVAAAPSPTPTVVSDITNSPGLNQRAEQLRKDAWKEEARRKTLQKNHTAAVKNGNQADAFMLLQDIQESSERIRKLHERATRRYYHARNHSEPTDLTGVSTIDVHGLLVPEAVRQTEKAFKQVLVEKRASLRVIVGKGLHSRDRKAKLRPAIEQAMAKHGISCAVDKQNPGVLELSTSWSIP